MGDSLFLDGEEQLELRGQLLFRVQAVREVYSSDSAVGVQLHPEGFNVIGTISTASEI